MNFHLLSSLLSISREPFSKLRKLNNKKEINGLSNGKYEGELQTVLILSRNAEMCGSQKVLNFAKKYELFLVPSSIFKRVSRSRGSRSKMVGGGHVL